MVALERKEVSDIITIEGFFDMKEEIVTDCKKVIKDEKVEGKINNVTRISCDICEIQFPDRQTYHDHKKKHDKRSFSCLNCGKQFIGLWLFHNHMRKHKLFTCEVCGEDRPVGNRSRHIKNCIIRHTKISCSNCEQEFDNPAKLRNHITFYHPKPKKDPEIKHCKWPNCSFKSKHSKSIKRHENENCPNRPDASISFIWF